MGHSRKYVMDFSKRYVGIASIVIVLLLSNSLAFYTVKEVDAQQLKLIVSAAEDPGQNDTFFGPQIVKIVIDDPSARNPDSSTSGLLVKGQQMQRVHLTDGSWMSFMAEKASFLLFLDIMTDGVRDSKIAVSESDDPDNRNTVDSITIVFGQADSFVREITESNNNLFVEVSKKDFFPTLPDPFTGIGAVNPDLDLNPSSEPEIDWPYIRLFGIQETDIVDIRLGNISVGLTYNRYYNDIQVGLDRNPYPVDSQIIVMFKDFMWNINPIEEDVVRFVLNKNTGEPNRIFYQPLRNFDPANDGLNLFDLLPALSLLNFDNRQILEVNGLTNLKYIEAYDSSTNTIVEFAEPGVRIDDLSTSQSPLITFIEQDPNASIFKTIDETKGSRSNIFAGERDTTADMNYFDIIATASIATQDGFVSVDKEVYDSADRANFTVTDQDLNSDSRVSETYDGIQSKAFIMIGEPFPLTNNNSFDTLPKDNDGNFLPDSIQAVVFNTLSGSAETVDIDEDGVDDFFASMDDIDDRNPTETDILALEFTTESIAGDLPTGFIINSNVKLADIASTVEFTVTKEELLESVDPFILTVSELEPEVDSAADNEEINVTFPLYNLINIDLSRLDAVFAKVFVELEASSGATTVTQMVDFNPFDPEDVDGDTIFIPDPLIGNSGFGSFRVLDFIIVDWNGDGIIGNSADATLLNSITLKFTVVITDSADTPVPITSANQQVVLDVAGLGVIRTIEETVGRISLDASENLVYRLELKEQGESSSNFIGRSDFMTVLHDDTVEKILQEIRAIGDPARIWMPNRFIPPNRVEVSYTDLDILGVFRQVSTSFIYETRNGEVSWDQGQYRFGQDAFLNVRDEDLNRKPNAVEQYTIPQDGFLFFEFAKQKADSDCQELTPIPDECFANFVMADLKETDPNSGQFRAQITMPSRVLLESGDIIKTINSQIRAVYIDVRDLSSNVNEFNGDTVIRSDIDPSQPQQEPITKNPAVVERDSIKIELDAPDYHPYSRVHTTVTAKDKNVDIFRSDVIFMSITRQLDDDGLLNYRLTETGVNTGVFAGYIDLRGPDGRDGGVGPRDGTLQVNVGDTLHVSFGAAALDIPIQYNDGKIFWNKSRYVIGEAAKLQVIEPDMNKNAGILEILKVTLLVKNAKISYDLRETEPDSGIFVAELPFVDITGRVLANEVGVAYGDTVTVVYDDATVPEALKSSADKSGILSIKVSVQIGDTLEAVGVNRVTQTDYKLVDDRSNTVTNPKVHDSYKVESTVHNNLANPLQFEFIVQITFENGIVEFLESKTKSVPPNDSVMPSLNWKPVKKGKYNVEIFVWQNLNSPSPLSSVMKSSVIVV